MRNGSLLSSILLGALVAGCGGGGSSGGGLAASTVAPATSGSPAPTTTTTPATTPPASSALPSGVLKVLTYNVAGLPQGLSSSNPVANTPQISPRLNAYDLVLVQEDFWYHAPLAQAALHPYRTPPLTGYSTPVNDGLNLFSQSPYYGLTRVRWARWYGLFSSSNDGLSSKGFTFTIHTLAPGVEVHVYDLHADAGGDAGDIDARRAQLTQLGDFMEAFSAGQPLLVAGDTNLRHTRPDDEATLVAFLTRMGLADAARTIGGLPESIDRVLLRSSADVELTPVRWRFADEFVDAAGQPLSDHEAVHVDVAWRRLR